LARTVLGAPSRACKQPKWSYAARRAGTACPAVRRPVARSVAHGVLWRRAMRVLVLEDDQKLARFLARVLAEEGFAVDLCARGLDAIAQAEGGLYDLVVLDWMVPETDGLSVCREIRRSGGTAPILMLTARGETRERVLGLEAGADDYMVKPFEVEEFVARVRALLRRTAGFGALRCGDLEVDPVARQAKLVGVALTLTNREYALLLHLVHRGDRVVKRSDLLAHVWGLKFDPGSNLVDVHVSRLRDKLGDRAWMIETVRGVGYRLRRQQAA
jgi:DNA-binding response OmpR family regulator